jgi:hypothetical protein
MAKLPESERPPWNDIQKRLFDKVSHRYRQLFIPDIQNDCACPTESYDCDAEMDTWYLTAPDKAEKVLFKTRLDLPMLEDISDSSIELLLKKACENISDTPNPDLVYTAIITNHHSDKISQIKPLNYIDRVALVDFIPVNEFIMLPDPEFFGALTVNIGGFGAFCFSGNLFKYKV